jgi:hypothetical protein
VPTLLQPHMDRATASFATGPLAGDLKFELELNPR